MEDTQQFFAQAPEALRRAVQKANKQAAELTKIEAERNCPVLTGFLRNSIFYTTNGYIGFSVGAKASYAVYVEYGTSKMRAQPYLRPAFIFVTQNIPSAMGKEIMDEFRSL